MFFFCHRNTSRYVASCRKPGPGLEKVFKLLSVYISRAPNTKTKKVLLCVLGVFLDLLRNLEPGIAGPRGDHLGIDRRTPIPGNCPESLSLGFASAKLLSVISWVFLEQLVLM